MINSSTTLRPTYGPPKHNFFSDIAIKAIYISLLVVGFAYPTHVRVLTCLRSYHISFLQRHISPQLYKHKIRNIRKAHDTLALTGSQAQLVTSTGWNIMHSNAIYSPTVHTLSISTYMHGSSESWQTLSHAKCCIDTDKGTATKGLSWDRFSHSSNSLSLWKHNTI
jgi:hypothetical protein